MYRRKKALAEYYGVSQGAIENLLNKMSDHIGDGKRYPKKVIKYYGRIKTVDTDAFDDFFDYAEALEMCPDIVPPYTPPIEAGLTESDLADRLEELKQGIAADVVHQLMWELKARKRA